LNNAAKKTEIEKPMKFTTVVKTLNAIEENVTNEN